MNHPAPLLRGHRSLHPHPRPSSPLHRRPRPGLSPSRRGHRMCRLPCRAIRSARCCPPGSMRPARLPGWFIALASSSASGRVWSSPSSCCVPLPASGKPRCWRSFWLSAECPPPGCPWMRRTTTRCASSRLCWQPSRPVIPPLGPARVRSDPFLPLPRLRAQGLLCELRAADLQFDAAEARHFLQAALERELSASTLATILSRTEGWIAGLQLTALSLQGRRTEAEVQQFLANSGGSHRYLVDYLVEEALVHQPEAVQSFLLHTCLLEPLSAALCAAVTGGSTAESAAMLAGLERANLFLFPVDERGEWYRYHQLWAAVLRVLLVRRLGAVGVAALYGRASRWYEHHDLPSEAIEAALKAGEFERAAQLVEQLSPLLLARSQYDTLRR